MTNQVEDINPFEQGTQIVEGSKSTVEVNNDAIEPDDYFKVLKSKLTKNQKDKLDKQLDVIAEQLTAANRVGQKNLLQRLAFTYDTLVKEQELLAVGVDTFVLKSDIQTFIDKVKPANSVKIIELERYPRAIPLKVLKEIERVKKLELFDDYCVVFTDYTDNDYKTEEEKEIVARNKDPVVFGYFKNKSQGFRHDRFYFIADWVDEYCDLDFTTMIERMSDQGIKNPEHKISTDDKYIRELVETVKKDMEKNPNNNLSIFVEPKQTFWERIKKVFTL
jgi:hypothetical protein